MNPHHAIPTIPLCPEPWQSNGYDEAFARQLHCASYGYQSGERKGPFIGIGRFEILVREDCARGQKVEFDVRLHRGVRDGVLAISIRGGSLL